MKCQSNYYIHINCLHTTIVLPQCCIGDYSAIFTTTTLVIKLYNYVGKRMIYLFILFIYLFSFTACVQVKSKLHAEGMPATGVDIQGEKKN